MPRPQHEQANPEVQEFLRSLSSRSTPSPRLPVHTYFQDEARFGQKGTITGLGAAGFASVRSSGIQLALRAGGRLHRHGVMSAVIMPTLNTEVVDLSGAVRTELPAGVHAVLIWDGAGFHTGEDVVVPSNVSLIQLPPY